MFRNSEKISTCTVEITQYALNQRSPAEGKGKGQKPLEAARPERAEAPSPGHRPGLLQTQTCRPVRAKALKYLAVYKAFALTGRLVDCHYTQGAALG